MKLENSFEVPSPPAEAWRVLLDIERIAPCMPGATLTEAVDDKTYKGEVSVRLGPVALTFSGTAKFEEIDDANHRALVKAQGSDSKGRGGANAEIAFRLEPFGDGSRVVVETDLVLSGSIAQYGRGVGMIQSVAGQLVGEFATNLEAELQKSEAAPAEAAKPISGLALMWRALLDAIRGIFRR
ncbi:MAG: SRPBCC family protein [Alphaproteobacteria bacterium]|mgnify:CR=1 FL=1|jgi:hypothetical protein|nr:SRPBCC family protein [Alphaproteobacteria bacterium]